MAAWSKIAPEIGDLPCRTLVHPWTDSCTRAAVDLFFSSCIGSVGFFSALHFLRYVSLYLKKKRKPSLKDFLIILGRSTAFAATVAVGTISISCFLRHLLGKYYFYSLVLVPATLAGFGIFLEARKGKELAANTFIGCALEYWINELKRRQILKWNSNHQTMTFMAISSLLSFLLNKTDYQTQYFWFFIPPKVDALENRQRECFHKENCWRHNLNLFLLYSSTGLVVQFLRLFLNHMKDPKYLMHALLSPKTFRLAAFLGGYVSVYEIIKCYLYKKEKRHTPYHDALAGFLAGLTFRFQPSLPILNSGIMAVIQILTQMGCELKILPDIPYMEILFIPVCGLMFHTRLLHSDDCPQLMIYIMSAITNLKTDYVAQNYKNLLQKLAVVRKNS